MFIQSNGGGVVDTEADLRALHPNLTLPKLLDDAVLARIGWARVEPAERPEFDPATHHLELGDVVKQNEKWVQVWDVVEGVEVVQATTFGKPVVLTKIAFRNHAAKCLGEGPAGMIRFMQIINSTKAQADLDELIGFVYSQYEAATTFERIEVQQFLDVLVADEEVLLTPEERGAIINAWPLDA